MSMDSSLHTQTLTERRAWKALKENYEQLQKIHLRDFFAADPQRGERFCAETAGLYLDYSKNRITEQSKRLLIQLAEDCHLRERIDAMFRGDKINTTEQRAALHIALRSPASEQILVDGVDVVSQVHSVLEQMAVFSQQVRSGQWLGYTGKRIRNIVNIGIGGSDLGPLMACHALKPYSQPGLRFRFVSNIDGSDFAEATHDLEPEETLFIICSKTFTTLETIANAHTARDWCLRALGDERAIGRHFVAVSANAEEVSKFGIDAGNRFALWDWVGGRYALGSAVGLSTMLSIGADNFRSMLMGFRAMDEHFRDAPFEKNLPVLIGLMGVWNTNFLGAQSVAVLPYAHYLKHFPAYLQQLMMESNGKHVTLNGASIDYQTSPVYWGEVGSNGQHSFYQLIHQGTQLIACDFIGFCKPLNSSQQQHDLLMTNLFAQSEAMAFGKTVEEVKKERIEDRLVPHRCFDGNRPSNTILAEQLTPCTLGALIALYEHSVFTQGVIWDIDSFDQWGVELGKALAKNLFKELGSAQAPHSIHDSSTQTLMQRYRKSKTS